MIWNIFQWRSLPADSMNSVTVRPEMVAIGPELKALAAALQLPAAAPAS